MNPYRRRFITLFIALFPLLMAQGQVYQFTANRLFAGDSLRVNDWWIKKFTRNLNSTDSDSHSMIPTNRAVMDAIHQFGGGGGGGTVNSDKSIIGDGSSGNKLKLVNDQASPSRWRFYGSNIKDSSKGFQEIEENFLGILYNKNSWADLSDFTTNGVTASVVSNKIQVIPSANGIFSCFLALNNTLDTIAYSNLQKWKFTIRATVDEKTGTSFGFGQGMKSYNTYGKFNAIGRFTAYTGGGELYLTGGLDSVTLNTSVRKLSFIAGDRVVLTVERDGGYLTTNVRNITTNSSLIDTSYYYSYNSAPYMPNTGKFTIWGFGGQFTIDSICISSNEVKNARLMVGGNSKMQGYLTSGYAQTAPAMLNANFKTTVLHAGGSDRTIDFARSLKEVLAQRPQQVILVDLMSNDFRQGIESAATIYARYDSIVTVMLNAGIDVYHAPLYETSIDLSGAYAHIVATYPASKILPTYPIAQLGGNLSGDGVHLTDAGNIALYNAIVQSYKLYGGNNRYGASGSAAISGTTGSYANFTSSSTIGPGSLSENTTRVVSSKGFEAPSLTLTNNSGSTDQKIWNQFPSGTTLSFATVNDSRLSNTNWMTVTRSGTTPTSIALLTNTSVAAASGTALSITPVANSSQIGISGTVAGYAIPTNFSINASGGLFGNYLNTNSGSSAHSEIALGSTGASAFIAYRNNNTNIEYAAGQETISGDFRINYGTFPTLTGGSNRFKISSAGAITFDNAYTFPTSDGSPGQALTTNGSGTLSFQSTDSALWKNDGTMNGDHILFGNNKKLTLGKGVNSLSRLDVAADSIVMSTSGSYGFQLSGPVTWSSTTVTNDNDYISAADHIIFLTVQIAADRTITLPSPGGLGITGREIKIWNKNNTANHWQFSGNVVDAAGAAITALSNNTWYCLISDGSKWSRTN